MTKFTISEAREAGTHTRNLIQWAHDLEATSLERMKVVPLSREAREGRHECISVDLADAMQARRDAARILRGMRREPGFMDGYRVAS